MEPKVFHSVSYDRPPLNTSWTCGTVSAPERIKCVAVPIVYNTDKDKRSRREYFQCLDFNNIKCWKRCSCTLQARKNKSMFGSKNKLQKHIKFNFNSNLGGLTKLLCYRSFQYLNEHKCASPLPLLQHYLADCGEGFLLLRTTEEYIVFKRQ